MQCAMCRDLYGVYYSVIVVFFMFLNSKSVLRRGCVVGVTGAYSTA